MATIYPDLENIGRLTVPPTAGERHLLSVLCDTLDDTYEVYFNPYLDGDRPDFIVLKPGCGALIIEVKDWNLDNYQIDIRNQWRCRDSAIRSPQQQAFHYKENLFNLHLPVLGLQQLKNRNFFNLISVAVYFHLASRERLNGLYSKPLEEVRERIQRLNRDRHSLDRENYDQQIDRLERQRFKLERDLGMSWGTDNVVKKFRMLDKMGKHSLFSSEIHEDFSRRLHPPAHTLHQGVEISLDAKQRALTHSRPGFAKVKGVAGSGKTTVLAQRAINAHKRHGGQVLILTYNITLRHYIRDTISRLQGGGDQCHYEIIHYHAFISNQINNYGIDIKPILEQLPPDQRDNLDVVYGMKDLFFGIDTEKYSTIFVDEVQDYHPEWVRLLRDCFLAEDGEMILFGDQSQNIYDRPSDRRASPIVLGFGEWIKLTTPYRSNGNSPLAQLFRDFQLQHLLQKYEDFEVFPAATVESTQRHMQLDLLNYEIYDGPYDWVGIIEKITHYIRDYQLHPNDIAVVSSKIDLLIPLNEALSKIENTKIMFEETSEIDALPPSAKNDPLRLRDERDKIRRRKKSFFMQNSGLIKLSTIHSFKGLEAETVFCILSPGDDAEMVYTGITRARRHLAVFDSSGSTYRSFFETHLVVNDASRVSA